MRRADGTQETSFGRVQRNTDIDELVRHRIVDVPQNAETIRRFHASLLRIFSENSDDRAAAHGAFLKLNRCAARAYFCIVNRKVPPKRATASTRSPRRCASDPRRPILVFGCRGGISRSQSTELFQLNKINHLQPTHPPARNPAATLLVGGAYVQIVVQFISSAKSSKSNRTAKHRNEHLIFIF